MICVELFWDPRGGNDSQTLQYFKPHHSSTKINTLQCLSQSIGNREIRMLGPHQIINARSLSPHKVTSVVWTELGTSSSPHSRLILFALRQEWTCTFPPVGLARAPFGAAVWFSHLLYGEQISFRVEKWAYFLWQPKILTDHGARRNPSFLSKAFTFAPDSSLNSCLLRMSELQNIGFPSLVTLGETASIENTFLVSVFLWNCFAVKCVSLLPTLLHTIVLFVTHELVSPWDGCLTWKKPPTPPPSIFEEFLCQEI